MSGREVKGLRQHRHAISVAVISAAATLVVAALPAIDFAYRRPSLRGALETAAMLIALLAAWLVLGRFLRSRALPDLVLVCALATLAGANLVAAVTLAIDSPTRFSTWAPVAGRVLGGALFAAAALAPAVDVRRPRVAAARALAGVGVTLAGIATVVALAGTRLPVGVETRLAGDPNLPDLDGHPVVLAAQLVTMAFFGAAALGFSARFARTGDDLMRFLAVGAVFAVFARVNYFLYPSLYSTWLYVGDVFRLLFWMTLLVGAAREIRRYWESATESAVLEERRRIARELHDGAAQELAYLVRRLRGIAADDAAVFAPLVGAAERGLDESRRAIAALSRPVDEQLDTSLAEAVEQVAARTGVRLALDLAAEVRVAPDVREGLIRIACEAVNNAANHSGASVVRVELVDGDPLQLRVRDEGAGFDPGAVQRGTAGGFGLSSMRQRAEQLGARLVVESALGRGTVVEVWLP